MDSKLSLVELPPNWLTLFGIQHGVMIPLVSLRLMEPTKREEVVTSILEELAKGEVCLLHDTLIFTDKFDAFTVKETKESTNGT